MKDFFETVLSSYLFAGICLTAFTLFIWGVTYALYFVLMLLNSIINPSF